jgi:hypothetical protein
MDKAEQVDADQCTKEVFGVTNQLIIKVDNIPNNNQYLHAVVCIDNVEYNVIYTTGALHRQ